MATNRNKSGSSGLRIVWIPGKKKQAKGTYNPTKKGNLSGSYQQKKIEPWSMGGSKGQEELLKAEVPGSDIVGSPSLVSCLPQTLGISAAVNDSPPEGTAETGEKSEEGAAAAPTNAEQQEGGGSAANNIPPQPLSPRLGPLANIDEDEHENDFDDAKDAANSNTATLLLKDRKMTKCVIPITTAGNDDNEEKKETVKDIADGVPHLRGLNRKQTIERSYRDQQNDKPQSKKLKEVKKDEKSGLNEKAVDCLYFGLMCCECSIQ